MWIYKSYEDMQKVWDKYQDKGVVIGYHLMILENKNQAIVKKLKIFVKLNLVLLFQ